MSDIAIRAENLGKLYRLGQRERYKAQRDTLTDAMYVPFRAVASSVCALMTADRRRTTDDSPALIGQSSSVNGRDSTIWALKDVSFEVKRGEALGIIGRNGAGKGALIKILLRITEPTEGYAGIHGRMGSLPEVGTGFQPDLTGRENIYQNSAGVWPTRTMLARVKNL